MNYVLKNEYYEATLSSKGAEMISLKNADGRELLWQNNTGSGWSDHAPVLFPLCGSYENRRYIILGEERPIELHGFALTSKFELVKKSDSSLEFVLRANEETRKSFPFEFELFVSYSLKGDTITLDAKVRNLSDITMPYMFGWHPGFNLPTDRGQDTEDYEIELKTDKLSWTPMSEDGVFYTEKAVDYPLANGAYKLNTKEIYPNDTMIFRGHKNQLLLHADNNPYSLDFKWSDNLPFLCIWKDEFNAAKFICLEPWSATPAGGTEPENFDTRKMQRLGAGEREVYTYTLKFTH